MTPREMTGIYDMTGHTHSIWALLDLPTIARHGKTDVWKTNILYITSFWQAVNSICMTTITAFLYYFFFKCFRMGNLVHRINFKVIQSIPFIACIHFYSDLWQCQKKKKEKEKKKKRKCNLTLAMSPTCQSNYTILICWHKFSLECSQ